MNVREFPSSDTPRSLEEWEQLRDLVVGRMQRPGESAEARLRWARTALTAVAAKARCGDQQRAAAESVAIRAYLIKELGEDRSDPDRNLGSLCSDVLNDLEIPLDTAERLAGDWRTSSRERILQLRRIKNTLTPLLLLREHLKDDDPTTQPIRAWLNLIPKLP
ncbi:hypothetical protein [Streptomyces roseolus]|uniref:hypothetical protein n=1 Tax=Streptomyces roseolus TaxID=67358 RepID=UPI0036E4AD83